MISVVIPVRNQASRLRLTLAALSRQEGIAPQDYEVIVVDDDSSDDVWGVVESAKLRAPYQIQKASCNSKGARGLARNRGASLALGDTIVFLDADALPGRHLLARHAEVLASSCQLCLGDIYVLPGTEFLSDPADGTLLAGMRPENPFILPLDFVERGVGDEELLAHAKKGGYPWLSRWHSQIEEVLADGGVQFAWMGVIPHNLSMLREAFSALGGFDATLTHMEGWELGIRALLGGYSVGFAERARSFHLFHYREPEPMTRNAEEAEALVSERYPEARLEVLMLWLYATQGDSYLAPEFGLENWRTVREMLPNPEWRAECQRLHRLWKRVRRQVSAVDHQLTALNPPFRSNTRPDSH